MGLLYDPQNINVGLAVAYFAEVGEPPPDNTVEFDGDWGGNWVNPGATEDGFRLTGDASTQQHNIEEQPNSVLTTLDSRNVGIAATLAEDTLESIRLSFGGGTITLDAASGVTDFQLSDGIEEFTIGLDMKIRNGATRRIILPRASGAGSVDVAFRRSAAKRMWPMQFTMLNKPSEMIVRNIPLGGATV